MILFTKNRKNFHPILNNLIKKSKFSDFFGKSLIFAIEINFRCEFDLFESIPLWSGYGSYKISFPNARNSCNISSDTQSKINIIYKRKAQCLHPLDTWPFKICWLVVQLFAKEIHSDSSVATWHQGKYYWSTWEKITAFWTQSTAVSLLHRENTKR